MALGWGSELFVANKSTKARWLVNKTRDSLETSIAWTIDGGSAAHPIKETKPSRQTRSRMDTSPFYSSSEKKQFFGAKRRKEFLLYRVMVFFWFVQMDTLWQQTFLLLFALFPNKTDLFVFVSCAEFDGSVLLGSNVQGKSVASENMVFRMMM